jgi:hypothetical protein
MSRDTVDGRLGTSLHLGEVLASNGGGLVWFRMVYGNCRKRLRAHSRAAQYGQA